ncbi:DNA-binding transcriptional regulator YhcF, GntR family [Anaerosphaera aminiphila DSM 21120]|uniref:DNA-binding transcriptional regulator YhcF, GntR family n=1 Tax=Anaerosphaera aminiphila DSM 21120 TaxID=1120995 RepID=A0A1M5SU99_9FIRM|nr:GntR family transcriptional regulator [Anaerosphaera aminiphila]SHH42084.1 DNA-binding transcriptional regulator YhcF, GntR family [Anaerosphaera aminiphila DSM 21120]
MDFNGNSPIYAQVMDLLKDKIISGDLNLGDKLPSVRDYSKELKVNPNTIQRAYQELERESLVFTQRGLGTFVTEDRELINTFKTDAINKLIETFIDDISRLGYEVEDILEILKTHLKEEK